MKKIFITILSFVFLIIPVVSAQTPSVTSPEVISPTLSTEEADIQNFKEKVATKVAELRRENNKAIAGTVTSTEGTTTMKFVTDNDVEFDVKLDENLTNYFQIAGTAVKEIKKEDVKKGDYIIVDGVVNDKTVQANSVYVDTLLLVLTGRIIEVNSDDFSIKVLGNDKETYTLDVQSATRQMLLNTTTLTEEKIGFSKIKEGDSIHFVVEKTGAEKEVNRFDAIKFLIIPQEYFIK